MRFTFEPGQTPFDRDVDLALLRRRAKIRIRHARSVLLASLLRENERDDGQELLLLEKSDEVDPQVRISRLVVPRHSSARRASSPGDRRGLFRRVLSRNRSTSAVRTS